MAKMTKEETIKMLHMANGNRWFGKPQYSCLTCSHSHSTEDNQLVCVENNDSHKHVNDDFVCEAWV